MKRIIYLYIIVFCLFGMVHAQSGTNPVRVVLETIPQQEMVADGAFQMELHKSIDYSEASGWSWMSYVYVTKNKFVDKGNVVVSERPLLGNRNMTVRLYRIGPTLNQCVFVLKNLDKNAEDIGYGMEVVRAYGIPNPVCDSVVSLNDDGYVFLKEGLYYYSPYKKVYDNMPKVVPVVWLERKTFDGVLVNRNPATVLTAEKKAALSRLQKGAVYHESPDGHYYYLYRDDYMPNSVLVVDDQVVELHAPYEEEELTLSFSHDGRHWMAVGKECYWFDGQIHSIEGYAITNFVVTDDGHYGYMAAPLGTESRGVTVVADGQVIRRNAEVCYFGLDDEGKLKFRFVTGERILQYEKENTVDVSASLTSVFFPDNLANDRTVTVSSNDGMHKLTYRRDQPSVEVDGEVVASSVPCYAIYAERSNMFIWNAVEAREDKTELVLYKYTVENNFFKKVFR